MIPDAIQSTQHNALLTAAAALAQQQWQEGGAAGVSNAFIGGAGANQPNMPTPSMAAAALPTTKKSAPPAVSPRAGKPKPPADEDGSTSGGEDSEEDDDEGKTPRKRRGEGKVGAACKTHRSETHVGTTPPFIIGPPHLLLPLA